MGLPMAALPVWIAVIVAAAVLIGAILLVVELFVSSNPSRVRCVVGERLVKLWHALRKQGQGQEEESSSGSVQRAEKRRKPRSLLIDFPRRFVAIAMLSGFTALFATVYIVTAWRGPATMEFHASFSGSTPSVTDQSTVAPTVGTNVSFQATLNPSGEQPPGAAVMVSGPSTIVLHDCHAFISGQMTKGYARGSKARIGVGNPGSGGVIQIQCSFSIARRIRSLETVTLEFSAGDSAAPEKRFLYLEPPSLKQAQETAEALADKEVRTSPALWEPDSMHPASGAFGEQGSEWTLLDPRHLHGFLSEPPGPTKTLRYLDDTRVQSSKVVTLNAVISSRPVTQDRFTAEGRDRKAIRQVYAIGQVPGEQDGWCTTTRSTAQRPLRLGDHLEVKAAVIEWGRSQESGDIAVMLNCPAVRVLGIDKAVTVSSAGGAAVPSRGNH